MIRQSSKFIIRIDILLALLGALGFAIPTLMGESIPVIPYVIVVLLMIMMIHFLFVRKILTPLRSFVEVADRVTDGEIVQDIEKLKLSELSELEGGFIKIVGSILESREAIENYMRTIGDMNKELEKKVDSLSVLFLASKSMGGSLNVDTLIRTLLSLFTERLDITGAGILIYNDRTDLVTVKDLLNLPPELFAKLRFYSDHLIVTSSFCEEAYWTPDEQTMNLLVAEFETDALRSLEMFIPMRIKDHFVGMLILSKKKGATPYTDNERQLIQAMVGLASTSINNAMLYERSESTKNELDRKVFNLMTLQQSGKVLSSTLNLEELIQISIDMFLETVWANKGILMLSTDDKAGFVVKAVKGLNESELKDLEQDPEEVWVMTTLQKDKRAILAQELAVNSSYQSYTTINRALRFAVYIPLLKEGELYGIVKIGGKINGESFTENDLEFFATLASQAVIAFENARLYSLAITDSITKLYVHRYFQLRLEEEVARSRRYNSTLSLLMCDLDHFKDINDQYGHQQGDTMLREISQIIKRNIRSTDIAARYGGEEFVVILPETTQSDARIVAERIRRDTSKHEFPPIAPGQPPLHCTISIGVAGFPLNANNKDELILKADTSMYLAKQMGRNRVVLCGVETLCGVD